MRQGFVDISFIFTGIITRTYSIQVPPFDRLGLMWSLHYGVEQYGWVNRRFWTRLFTSVGTWTLPTLSTSGYQFCIFFSDFSCLCCPKWDIRAHRAWPWQTNKQTKNIVYVGFYAFLRSRMVYNLVTQIYLWQVTMGVTPLGEYPLDLLVQALSLSYWKQGNILLYVIIQFTYTLWKWWRHLVTKSCFHVDSGSKHWM